MQQLWRVIRACIALVPLEFIKLSLSDPTLWLCFPVWMQDLKVSGEEQWVTKKCFMSCYKLPLSIFCAPFRILLFIISEYVFILPLNNTEWARNCDCCEIRERNSCLMLWQSIKGNMAAADTKLCPNTLIIAATTSACLFLNSFCF